MGLRRRQLTMDDLAERRDEAATAVEEQRGEAFGFAVGAVEGLFGKQVLNLRDAVELWSWNGEPEVQEGDLASGLFRFSAEVRVRLAEGVADLPVHCVVGVHPGGDFLGPAAAESASFALRIADQEIEGLVERAFFGRMKLDHMRYPRGLDQFVSDVYGFIEAKVALGDVSRLGEARAPEAGLGQQAPELGH